MTSIYSTISSPDFTAPECRINYVHAAHSAFLQEIVTNNFLKEIYFAGDVNILSIRLDLRASFSRDATVEYRQKLYTA